MQDRGRILALTASQFVLDFVTRRARIRRAILLLLDVGEIFEKTREIVLFRRSELVRGSRGEVSDDLLDEEFDTVDLRSTNSRNKGFRVIA